MYALTDMHPDDSTRQEPSSTFASETYSGAAGLVQPETAWMQVPLSRVALAL